MNEALFHFVIRNGNLYYRGRDLSRARHIAETVAKEHGGMVYISTACEVFSTAGSRSLTDMDFAPGGEDLA